MLLKILLTVVLFAGVVVSIYDPSHTDKPKSYRRDPHIARELQRHQRRRSYQRDHRPRLSPARFQQLERHANHVRPGLDYANNFDAHYGGCPSGFTGQLPYPYDCRRFVNCWKGRAYIQTCGPGTVFNDQTMECDSPSKVVCHGLGGGSTTSSNRLARIQTDEDQVACPVGFTGLLPHPHDCSKFLNCASGSMHVQVCGPGTMFSPQMNVCDFAGKVDCSGRGGQGPTQPGAGFTSPGEEFTPYPRPQSNRGGKTFETAPRENQAGNWDQPQRKGWSHRHNHRQPPPTHQNHNCTEAHEHYQHTPPPPSRGHTPPPPPRGHTPLVYRDRWSSMNRTRPDAPGSRPGWQTTKTPQSPWTRTTITTGWVPAPEANTTPPPTWQSHGSPGTTHTTTTTFTGQRPTSWAPIPPTTTSTTPQPTWAGHGTSGVRTTPRPQSNYPAPPDTQTTIYYAQPVDDDQPSEEVFSDIYGADISEITLPGSRRNASRGVFFPAQPSHPSRDAMHIPNLNLMPPHFSPQPADDDRQSPVPEQFPDYSSPYPSYAVPQPRPQAESHLQPQPRPQQEPQPHPRPSYGSPNPPARDLSPSYGSAYPPDRDPSPVSMDTVNIPSMTLLPPHRSPPVDDGQKQLPDQFPDFSAPQPSYPDLSPPSDGGRPPHTSLTPPDKDPGDWMAPFPEPKPPFPWDQKIFNTTTYVFSSSTPPPDESNLFGGLLPPLPSAPQTPELPAYTPLRPPSTPTPSYRPLYAPMTTTTTTTTTTTPPPGVKTNVRTFLVYPPPPVVQNATTRIHPSPFYSPSYSGVAHSRNATWSAPPPIKTSIPSKGTPSPRSSTTTFVPEPELFESENFEPEIIFSHDGGVVLAPMPSHGNREFYRHTTTPPPPVENTSDEASPLPLSEAIRLLLRPYFNRSGTVTDDMATKAETHIMSLSRSKEPTTTPSPSTSTTTTTTTTTTTSTIAPELAQDVELVFAGEQNSLRPSHAHSIPPPSNSQVHPPSKYHQHPGHHHRDFHRKHPHLPNPFENELGGHEEPKVTSRTPNPAVDDVCQFDCGNGKCVKTFETCDGINHCGNRRDEEVCEHLGYEIRLSEIDRGRVEVKILGQWGYVCDDKFGILDANVVCRELGFSNGASEVHGNSFYPPPDNKNVSFVMDELDCSGNETSLQQCPFMGWGVSDCGSDEVVGVRCKTQALVCPNDYWLCRSSQECIPPAFVCDNVPDCSDQSDESAAVCNSTVEFRLKDGQTRQEGRLEVLYRGVWGSICDDDFGQTEAQVACNSLGFYGPSKIVKNAFGPGSGPIWLDQVSCYGNESSIDACAHWSWGEHNCNHTEDVSIRCTSGTPPRSATKGRQSPPTDDLQTTTPDDIGMDLYPMERSSKFKNTRKTCGHFNPNLTDEIPKEFERVVQGNVARRGHHPWQATIRTKGRGGISSHWCGAVLISKKHLLTAAHCLVGYPKGAYFIRLGDHIANIAESSEIDSYIENWYIHDQFRNGTHMNNDIALIVMKNPVRFNDYIQPICLPQQGAEYPEGRRCTISGWGSIQSGVSTPSNNLRVAEIPVISDDVCKLPHVYGKSITEGMFCAGYLEEGVDACEGDSGGPFVCSDDGVETLYGIISWGQQCGHANKPGVYVKIEKYLEWIYEKIRFSMQQSN